MARTRTRSRLLSTRAARGTRRSALGRLAGVHRLRRLLLVGALASSAAIFGAGASGAATTPERIVSLSPSATDMLFAIGAGKQVVAVDADSTYPANAPHTSLSGLTPNVEAIAKYRPDLVVVSYAPSGLTANLHKLGIAVLIEPATANLAGSYAQINQLGKLTGHVRTASSLVASMRKQIAALVKATPKPPHALTYYYELDQTYYSATSSTFIGSVLGLFGLKNIADKAAHASSGYPQLSAEYIVKADPDVIFLADTQCCGQSAKTVAARPGWSKITAVRDGGVVLLNDSIASQWGPRIVDLVQDVHGALAKIEKRQ